MQKLFKAVPLSGVSKTVFVTVLEPFPDTLTRAARR